MMAADAGIGLRYPVPWDQVEKETLEHFQTIVRMDTSSPPGNETLVAEYLKQVLEREGISGRLLALDPKRANLVARIRGKGSKRPILVMGHTDVVGVQREKWSVDPFGAVRKDGYIWGRGTGDDKDNVTAGLMLLLLLKRQGVKLDREVVFLAEAGEEGYNREGLRYVIANHWDEIDAEFALAEGGGGIIKDGKVLYLSVATSEKVRIEVQLLARGTAGHGSIPRPDNAVVRLANAISRVAEWAQPMRLDETTRTYFQRLAGISPPEAAARYRAILTSNERAAAERYFAQHELRHNSMIRTSLSPNVLKAGFRANVIPSEAEALIDIRALPDEDLQKFVERLREVIEDSHIEIKVNSGRPAAQASSLNTEMFAALEAAQRRLYPESITIPILLPGATDMSPLRAKGIQAYGIGPVVDSDETGGAHSDDERILEKSLHDFVRFIWHAILEVAAAK
ncbi:MAG TPA: M20/M25/M40 family metallo-hydrolase [Thermodesulfobacteriota bacterium]|nr:M20/M25/M40 family metallo-hydrolase [Thermodesulfobacteriota bacterium]